MKNFTPAVLMAAVLGLAVPRLSAAEQLVDTAAAAKEKRKKSTSRVLTNKDVVQSKGTLVETKGGGPQEALPPPENLVEKHEKEKAERAASEDRLRLARSLVADLEKQLAGVEQSYFAESDLQHRDLVIVKRFDEVRRQLEDARAELATLLPPE